jgi:hypothetical protein
LRRIYAEERLQVRRRRGRKRALAARAPLALPQGPNQRWSRASNGRLRDELLNETLFSSLAHARAVLAEWQVVAGFEELGQHRMAARL